jgi:hypothetical protein
MGKINLGTYSKGFCLRPIIIIGILLILVLVSFTSFTVNINRSDMDINSDKAADNDINNKLEVNTVQETSDLKFDAEIYKIELYGEEWDMVEIDGCIFNTITGQPRFPVKTVELKLPAELKKIDVKYSELEQISSLRLPPAPDVLIWTEEHLQEINEGLPGGSEDYYRADEFIPDEDFEVTYIGNKLENDNLFYFYSLKLYPLKYNPVEESGNFYKRAEITYEYQEQIDTRSNDIKEISSRVGPSLYRYLIICDSDYVDELQPFVNWKTQKGLPAKIVTVEEIYSNPLFNGVDQPEEIRNCIQYGYSEWGVEYVLLAGDQDTVPTRHTYDAQYVYTGDDGIIPADSYYACIDEGTTWNEDSDSNWGEFGELDDIIPDVAVGRIAINSENKMAEWVVENIKYEKDPPQGNWFNNLTLVADYGFAVGDCADQADFLFNTYYQNDYSAYSKLYDDASGTDYISGAKIQEKINNGSALVVYTDHANTNSWGSTIIFTNAQVTALNNGGMKPVVYVMACLSAGFDHPTMACLGEAFTENPDRGAIAYIGSSRVAVGAVGSAYSYEPTATGLEEDFARQLNLALDNDPSQLRVGLIHKNALEYYAVQWGSLFPGGSVNNFAQRSWLLLTLLGDPDSPIWTAEPQNFKITNSSKKLGSGKVELKVKITNTIDLGTGIENALVAISGGGSTYDYNYTDSSGEITFIITDPSITEVDVTVTTPNFIPLETKAGIADFFPPSTSVEITPASPDGNNGWYRTSPTINLTTEPLATTYYHWDSDADGVYTETLVVPDGIYTLYFHSKDVNDNVEAESSVIIKVDTKKPKTDYNITPDSPDGDNGWYVNFPSLNLSAKVNQSDESNITIYYHWDTDPDLTFTDALQANEGEHTFYYHSRDDAGNIESERSMVINVDTIFPSSNITITPFEPDGGGNWYLTSPNITIELNQSAVEENQTTFYYYWDDEVPNTFIENLTPPEGVHTFHYYAIDFAGNQESEHAQEFKLDTILPESEISVTPSDPDGDNDWYRSAPNITIETNNSKLGFDNCSNETIYYHWDSEPYNVYNDSVRLNLTEGFHTLHYYSTDIAGNIEVNRSIHFKLDSIVPVTTLNVTPGVPDNLEGWYLSVPQIDFIDEDNVTTYYNWDNEVNRTYTSNQSLFPDEGVHTINFYSVDEAGNLESRRSSTFKIDLELPVPSLLVDLNEVYILENIVFNGSGSYDFNGIQEYYFNFGDGNNSGWITEMDVSHNYTESGIYDVTLKVRDNSGRVSIKRTNVTITINKKSKKADDDDQWSFLPDDVSSLTMIFGILVLVVILILLVLASYLRKRRRRRYPPRGRRYREDQPPPRRRRGDRRRDRHYYEDDYETEPEIDWDQEEYGEEPYYDDEDYYDDEYEEPYDEYDDEEYWDEEEEFDEYGEDEYYEDEDEDLEWDSEEQPEDEDEVDWESDDEEEDWDSGEGSEDEYYEEDTDDYEDDRDGYEAEDEYEDEYYETRGSDQDYDYYDEPDHYSAQPSEPAPPPQKIRRRKLIPTWRSKNYKRRKPGLIDTEDMKSSNTFEDYEDDEF